MRALAIAATGMNAQQLNVEVIANNIANINTTSFKRARAEFTDLLYQTERLQGVPNRGALPACNAAQNFQVAYVGFESRGLSARPSRVWRHSGTPPSPR